MAVRAALYVVLLVAAFGSFSASQGSEAQTSTGRRLPVATGAALAVVALPTIAQLTFAPWLLDDLQRNWAAISDGQVWRLVTALVVQDGGLAGAVFNLVSLAVIGSAAEAAWGARRWVVLALTAGVGAQFWGGVVQRVGAGNSVVVFGLAASLAVSGLRSARAVPQLLGMISVLAAATLLIVGDIHGGAAAIGGAWGATFASARRPAPP